MGAARSKSHVSRYVTEDEIFWQNQLSKFSVSGLTKKHYCRQNEINYDRFIYWTRKLFTQKTKLAPDQRLNLEKPKKLLPVQLKPELKNSEFGSLFSLTLKNGFILQIHNEQALSIILEKMA